MSQARPLIFIYSFIIYVYPSLYSIIRPTKPNNKNIKHLILQKTTSRLSGDDDDNIFESDTKVWAEIEYYLTI